MLEIANHQVEFENLPLEFSVISTEGSTTRTLSYCFSDQSRQPVAEGIRAQSQTHPKALWRLVSRLSCTAHDMYTSSGAAASEQTLSVGNLYSSLTSFNEAG